MVGYFHKAYLMMIVELKAQNKEYTTIWVSQFCSQEN